MGKKVISKLYDKERSETIYIFSDKSFSCIKKDGSIGEYHCGEELPFRTIYSNLSVIYMKGNKFHRDGDKPSYITDDAVYYYKECFLHRSGDKPAIISQNILEYWKGGKLHRDGDKPALICNANKNFPHTYIGQFQEKGIVYYNRGIIHRDKGPAIITPEKRIWVQQGKITLEDYNSVQNFEGEMNGHRELFLQVSEW